MFRSASDLAHPLLLKSRGRHDNSELKNPEDEILKFHHISKHYGSFWANRDITLTLNFGNVIGLLGPNGAGKTTLLRQLVGLTRPSEGYIRVGDRRIQPGKPWVRQLISYLPQHPLAISDLTVEEAIRSTALLRGYSRTGSRSRTEDLIAQLDLGDIRHRQVAGLSGGEHRLVGIASVLVAPTPLVALDEPTNELDPLMRRRVWQLIAGLRQPDRLLLLISHNVLEAEHALDRVIIMNHGQITNDGSPHLLRRQMGDVVTVTLGSDPLARHILLADLRQLSLLHVREDPDAGTVRFTTARQHAFSLLANWLPKPGMVQSIQITEPSLEDIYLHIRAQWTSTPPDTHSAREAMHP